MEYNNLVRDFIPQIIIDEWKKIQTHIADDIEYWEALKNKLQEEVIEAKESVNNKKLLEELADIVEVIYAILKYKWYSIEELEKTRLEKREKRWGFNDRIILEKVY